uniref:CAP-Gly domain-containing linker protein 4 n=1 Tax=Geotrypetes seraphini TaxID=260995 RepID=A0A6P8Q5M5_GEOSA|nr:CAP-Gly domain-containing linker protein 4 [Geotrypetes seraphini]XP_033795053.1 CAP-Gly domain-containing linker protein 4 [Geotrypetes seraphini]XP_033795054.1 CAP-Gly domain-containing linker protein 4 [Geotrypetes seraphini]
MTIEDFSETDPEEIPSGRYQFSFPGSNRPVTFSVAAAPMPSNYEFSFFDPNDAACQEILVNPNTSVSELFAILRQWVPQVQQNIDVIGNEILKRECNVNDRDGLTDMTLLHYTCKSGAQGIGNVETSSKFASKLIELGADIGLRSRWTNMNALHYAAYFDVPELIGVLLKASKPKDVDSTCSDFDFGTALHIAASNLCSAAVKCLLENGANPAFRDDKGRIPAAVVPDPVDMPLEMADAAAVAKELKQILLEAFPLAYDISKAMLPNNDHISGKAMLMSDVLQLGDRVAIAGQKVGTLRFCGSSKFASGQWAGVELDEPEGKNDGSVGGVQYFKCAPKYGIFAPLSKINKASDLMKTSRNAVTRSSTPVKPLKMDVTCLTSKVNTGLTVSSKNGSCEMMRLVPTEEVAKAATEKEGSVPESSCSSSTSSLENKHSQQVHPHQRNTNNSNKRTAFKPVANSFRSNTGLQNRATSVGNVHFDETDIQVGDKVLVVGQRIGTVRFYGKTSFAPGFWYGVDLDKPHGKNDGSVGGVQYFTCRPKHGIFAPPSRVQKISGSLDSLSEIPASKLNHSFPGFRRSYSTTSEVPSQKEINRRSSFGRSKNPILHRSWSSTATSSKEGTVKLHEGSQVLLTSSNEMATIRYIGPTEFASGIWLGLELRCSKGKNDGSVEDKRYFTCKPNYGVLVRPSRVTYRGINGAKLVDDIC